MQQTRVLIVGGTSCDTIIHLDEFIRPVAQTVQAGRSYRATGGTGAGKAMNLASLGFDVTVHTIVGNDPEAEAVLASLRHPNIRRLVTRTEQATEQHCNLMSAGGERISIYTQPPANPDNLDLSEAEAALACCDIAAISILDYTRPLLAKAQALNKPLWTDIHDYDGQNPWYRQFIDTASVIFVSSDCLPDYRRFMDEQIAAGKELVVCTHGKRGAEALDSAGNWYRQPVVDGYPLVDSNGAGDAFFSGFLYAFMKHRDIPQCLRYASLSAALCIGSEQLAAASLSPQLLERLHSQKF